MPATDEVCFRRLRLPFGRGEVVIDWDDPADGSAPVPFTVWTMGNPGTPGTPTCMVLTEADEVGWRRAPDTEATGSGDSTSPGAGAPGAGNEG